MSSYALEWLVLFRVILTFDFVPKKKKKDICRVVDPPLLAWLLIVARVGTRVACVNVLADPLRAAEGHRVGWLRRGGGGGGGCRSSETCRRVNRLTGDNQRLHTEENFFFGAVESTGG